MPPRPRRVVASGALLLVVWGILGAYRSPAGWTGYVLTPDQTAAVHQPSAGHTPVAGLVDRPRPPNAPANVPLASATVGRQPITPQHVAKSEGSTASVGRQKPETPCDKRSSLHSSCSKCRSGSPGDGGVEAIGGLCREYCSRKGSGYCGIGDDYVNDGLDCRACRRWVPDGDTSQSQGGHSDLHVATTSGDEIAPMLLADDRIDAVCFEPASVVDSRNIFGAAAGCIGGHPCPTFASLAVAQATCSRDSRCSSVALNVHNPSEPKFELRSGTAKSEAASTMLEQDQIPDTVVWRVAARLDSNSRILCAAHVIDFCEDSNLTDTSMSSSISSNIEIYITVKTSASRGNHARRPLSLLRSWANTRSVRDYTFFFTDAAERDPALLAMSGGETHWIDTGCGSARGRSLCCKTDAELRGFVAWANAHGTDGGRPQANGQGVRWWCHLDDDNYVLLGPLRKFLSELLQPDTVPYYVGRAGPTKSGNRLHAPFAMGGAGYCLNEVAARLAAKELKHDHGESSAANLGLRALCDEIDYPDDMALGVLMTQRLKPPVALTEDPLANVRTGPRSWNGGFYGGRFHSQWEIYGHSLAELMGPLLAAQPQPGQQLTASRRPHEQFVYGWDRQDKIKTSTPRDMLHLHYYLNLLSQEYGTTGGISSACYGEAQHGPVTADGALERRLASNGLMLAYQYGSVSAAMLGCSRLSDACSVVAAVDIAGGGADSGCAYVLFGAMPPGVANEGATGWKQGCGTAWAKVPANGPCLEPRVYEVERAAREYAKDEAESDYIRPYGLDRVL